MKTKHVEGIKRGEIMLYALSTCMWCKKTKKFLNELSVEYSYVDVDLLSEKERGNAEQDIIRWNPACSFPTIVINNKKCIVGYRKDDIVEALEP